MEPDSSDPLQRSADLRRRDRQRHEIARAIDQGLLQRVADLAHEHLAEFGDDHDVRRIVQDTLSGAADHRDRRRAAEFGPAADAG